jgi:hypothetical protein
MPAQYGFRSRHGRCSGFLAGAVPITALKTIQFFRGIDVDEDPWAIAEIDGGPG